MKNDTLLMEENGIELTPRFDRGESNDFNHSVYVLYAFIYFILDGKMKSAGFF